MKKTAVGTDIGGSHISAVAIDIAGKRMIRGSYSNINVNNKASAADILRCWCNALEKTLENIGRNELTGIGFAMPGPFDYEKGIGRFTGEVDKYENLNGINVADELRALMHLPADIPLRFMNDATSFAAGESWVGKSAAYTRSMAITLGTGFGSAFIDGGIPVLERDDVPGMGCLWHLPYRDGIADDYFSTRWFIRKYASVRGTTPGGVKEIAEEAEKDQKTKALFIDFGTNLGQFLGPWIRKFDTRCLVIGGNMTGAYHLFEKPLKKALSEQSTYPDIHLSQLLEKAAMTGSARLMDEVFWQHIKPLLSKM